MRGATNPTAFTQGYPSKPVRLIEPFGAGGGVDVIARAVAQKLSGLLGQPVTVENHPSAGSTAAPVLVAKAPPDGYTLLVNISAQSYSAALLKYLPYDPLKGFIAIAPLTSQPYVLVAGKPAGVATVAELVAAAKAKPGELKFGSAGMGTGTHLGVEKFNLEAGIRAIHVPAQPVDAIADIIANTVAGHTAYMMAPIPLALHDIRDEERRLDRLLSREESEGWMSASKKRTANKHVMGASEAAEPLTAARPRIHSGTSMISLVKRGDGVPRSHPRQVLLVFLRSR